MTDRRGVDADPADDAAADGAVAVDRAMAQTPRERFLPPDQQRFAGLDRPLPIGGGQTNSQPRTVRNMMVALRVRPRHRVLDVGAGSGWSTAILAQLVGPDGAVIGVERRPELAEWGAGNLAAAELPQARLLPADPTVLGYPSGAPYDRILVSAAADTVPDELVDQLAADGTMVIPVREHLLRVRPGRPDQDLGLYSFVPLIQDG